LASEDIPGNDPWWFRHFFSAKRLNLLPDKSQLRARFRSERDRFVEDLSDADRLRAFSVAPSPLRKLFTPNIVVSAYQPTGSEADPMRLLAQAAEAGCITALPHVTSRAAPMQFLRWGHGDPLVPGPFGLMQPDIHAERCKPDIVLVPLLAFTDGGVRLGQGAGHYDRALSLLDGSTAVGIAWSVQQAEILPHDPWDIPLDAILTEKAWIEP
jgi:5-formyltetrahydrofolate cyclo-ligase